MSTTIPQRDLRNHNKQILDRVASGESFTVTRDGEPVADLTPHVTSVRPPRFRRASDVRSTSLTSDQAARWVADIRAAHDDFDTAPSDPWSRGTTR